MTTPTFHPSQIGGPRITPHTYTSSPLLLLRQDILAALYYLPLAPSIFLPLSGTSPASRMSELYPYDLGNLWTLVLHFILLAMQIPFVLSIPFWVLFPVGWLLLAVGAFGLMNAVVCWVLNGSGTNFESEERFAERRKEHEHEQWIFLNGVAVGKHWMVSNLNRLALTFGRPILGFHNKTNGVIFDIVECLIQRNFNYATQDVRNCYVVVKDALYRKELTKVVFILHSQGGIEGAMIIDWLLQEVPADLLAKLEVYTFGNAANHFNNPHQHLVSQHAALSSPSTIATTRVTTQVNYHDPMSIHATPNENLINRKSSCHNSINGKTIRYIEHYAHNSDFVALWGVLYFINNKSCDLTTPRFMGRIFERNHSGHLLNQHYLDGMFPLVPSLDKNGGIGGSGFDGCDENNAFMDSTMKLGCGHEEEKADREGLDISYLCAQGGEDEEALLRDLGSPTSTHLSRLALRPGLHNGRGKTGKKGEYKVRDLSRLWRYRNGGSPKPDEVDLAFLRVASGLSCS